MKNEKLRIIISSLLIGLILYSAFETGQFFSSSEKIRSRVLRLHIRANSDSPEDQALKLLVRDEILKAGKEAFSGAENLNEALSKIEESKSFLEKTARKVIEENGFDYPVRIETGIEFFKTRTYENEVTLPAGDYTAVKVIIGDGKGENWWCVMFPPMCLPAAEGEKELSDVLSEKEENLTKKNPRFEIRFKIVELIEKIRIKLK